MRLVSFKIDDEQWKEFGKLARQRRQSRSAFLRDFVASEIQGVATAGSARDAFYDLMAEIQQVREKTSN